MFDSVIAAGFMHLQGHGLEPGCPADLVVLQARDLVEALRLRAMRLQVFRRAAVIASAAREEPTLILGDSGRRVDFLLGGLAQGIR